MHTPNQLGETVGVVVQNSPDYVARVFSLLQEGRIVVPLRSREDRQRIDATSLAEIQEPRPGYGLSTFDYTESDTDQPALISFTSGTEGEPKGVILTHRALNDVVHRLLEVMKIDASIREYIGVPVYHSFGFGRCRAIAAAGGQGIIPENGFDPTELAELLEAGAINAVSAVPSLWRTVLLQASLFKKHGRAVRWIEIGSQYMAAEEKVALRELFPKAKIVQHYGLTEASRTTFLEIHSVSGAELESVGKCYGSVQLRIADDGRIQVKGPHLAKTLLVNGQTQDPTGPDGWLVTSDLGHLADDYVYFDGRADDVINCGGLKVSPEKLEQAIRARLPEATDCAVAPIPDEIRGQGVLLCCTPSSWPHRNAILLALAAELEEYGIRSKGAIHVCQVSDLPRTSTGKVRRKELALANAGAPSATWEKAVPFSGTTTEGKPTSARELELLEIWRLALGTKDLRVDETFYDLGGDSITALNVVVRMTRAGVSSKVSRAIFQGASIRKLAALEELGEHSEPLPTERPHSEYLSTLMVNALRGILVASVVIGHWSGGVLERLPETFRPLEVVLAPYFSFGTPGFAIVFGLGFGYLYLPKVRTAPQRVWAAMRLGTMIVGAGLLLLVTFSLLLRDKGFDQDTIVKSFYGVLTFYFLALPSMPLWARAATAAHRKYWIATLAGLACAAFLASLGFQSWLAPLKLSGPLELVRLMLVAKYNYFAMMSGVLCGVALGHFSREHSESAQTPRQLVVAGLGTTALGVALAASLGDLQLLWSWPSPLRGWKWVFYFGVVMILLGWLWKLRESYEKRRPMTRRLTEIAAAIGQLALPFYVLHELVLPLKALLVRLGTPDPIAVLLALGSFLLTSFFLIRKVLGLVHWS